MNHKLGIGGVVLVGTVVRVEVLNGGLNAYHEPFDVAVSIGVIV